MRARKLVYDLHYIEKASFWLDCRILARTLFKLFGLSCYVIPPISMVADSVVGARHRP